MAFHPYPRVIPSVFNRSGFGPPRGLTPASACPWIAHLASRLRQATIYAILKARFHYGSVLTLTSPLTATRWLILQKARRHSAWLLRLLVGTRFQVLFHSPLGVLFTFPSRYWFAIGHRRVLSLGGWSPQIHTGFHVSGITRDPSLGPAVLRVRGSHPVSPGFPAGSPGPRVSDPTPPLQRRDGGSHYPTCGNAWRLTRARV